MMINECLDLAKQAHKVPGLIPIHVAAKVPVFLKEERKRLRLLSSMISHDFKHLQGHFKEKLGQVEAAISVYEPHGCLH